MSYRINTNIAAMNAHQIGTMTNRNIGTSLEKLSSGLRINKAADDASGMAIADSLRSQANGLGQAINNANDAIGIIQTADKGMDEQVKILDTIKTKAVQAAQDGQTIHTRKAIQSDINRLLEELDNIANTTSFNGRKLLSGAFTNKEFQIGAYSNETLKVTIGATNSDKIGSVRAETGSLIKEEGEVSLKFVNSANGRDIMLETTTISTSAGTGVGVLAETINRHSDQTGIRASFGVESTGDFRLAEGKIEGLNINGVNVGTVNNIKSGDKDGRLQNAINNVRDKTGVEAFTDTEGKLHLRSTDGRGIKVTTESEQKITSQKEIEAGEVKNFSINGVEIGTFSAVQAGDADGQLVNAINAKQNETGVSARVEDNKLVLEGLKDAEGNLVDEEMIIHARMDKGPIKDMQSFNKVTPDDENYGRLSLVKLGARDIIISGVGGMAGFSSTVAEQTVNLRTVLGQFDADVASAIGANANDILARDNEQGMGTGVTSLKGAMLVMDIAEAGVKDLDKIRSDLGSVQNQLVATINNVSVTQVNVKAAESQIRDVDFAQESSTFNKNNILAQSGSYAMTQANSVQQNVLKLLQ